MKIIPMSELISAIEQKDTARALQLIPSSDIGYVNNYGDTALIWACSRKMFDVAMALIATGQSKPEHVNNYGDTALLFACRNNMPDVAMALIATGQSNPTHNNKGNTALSFAKQINMTGVINALEDYDNYITPIKYNKQPSCNNSTNTRFSITPIRWNHNK